MKPESLTLITGNQSKAQQVEKYLSIPAEHIKIDLIEIQDVDLETVTKHKLQEAYKMLGKPVLVDDNALIINAMGKLPGTFIKFFEKELGHEKICRIVDIFEDRTAVAVVTLGITDGDATEIFTGEIHGVIADHPRGQGGFGWDTIFIPDGFLQTRAEMNEEDYDETSPRKFALEKLEKYLKH